MYQSSLPQKRPNDDIIDDRDHSRTTNGTLPRVTASGQKRPTSIYRTARGDGRTAVKDIEFPPSPKDNLHASPFPKLFSSPLNGGPTRLPSLTRFAYNNNNNNNDKPRNVFSRYNDILNDSKKTSDIQRAPAKPVMKSTNDKESMVLGLQQQFDTIPLGTIQTAAKYHDTYEDAAKWLAKDFPQGQMATNGKSSNNVEILSSKRQVEKPLKSIREKFSSNTKTHEPLPEESDAIIEQKPRKRLVKSKHVDLEEWEENIIEIDSDGSEVEEQESEGEKEFDQRVLKFLNTASAADISDITACSMDHANAIVDSRPFSSLDEVSEVEVDSANSTPSSDSLPARRRGGKRKTVGEKIVTACATVSICFLFLV